MIVFRSGEYSFVEEYGEVPSPECDVVDNKGNHCPDTPEHTVIYQGKTVRLCERCYQGWKIGRFRR